MWIGPAGLWRTLISGGGFEASGTSSEVSGTFGRGFGNHGRFPPLSRFEVSGTSESEVEVTGTRIRGYEDPGFGGSGTATRGYRNRKCCKPLGGKAFLD